MSINSIRTLLLALYFLTFALSDKIFYKNEHIRWLPDIYDLRYEPIYSKEDAPAGDDAPLIHYSLSIKTMQYNQLVFLIIASRDALLDNGILPTYVECFSGDVFEQSYHKKQVIFDRNGIGQLNGTFFVKKSNLYTSYILACGLGATVNGEMTFANPYGYLPGHKYYYLPFYTTMTFVYIFMLCCWVYLIYKYSTEVLIHHFFISAVCWFTLLEVLLNCIEVHHFNTTGVRSVFAYTAAHLTLIFRKTLSRILIIYVSSGVGVAKAKLSDRSFVFLTSTSTTYFVLSFILELYKLSNYRATEVLDYFLVTFEILIACIDAIYYIWLFIALSETLEDLKSHELYKLRLYNKFSIVLVLALISTTVFNLYNAHYRSTLAWSSPTGWSKFWFVEEGYWMIQSTMIIAVIMYLWRPTTNSSRYAFHEQLPTYDVSVDEKKEYLHRTPLSPTTDSLIGVDLSLTENSSSKRHIEKDASSEGPELKDARNFLIHFSEESDDDLEITSLTKIRRSSIETTRNLDDKPKMESLLTQSEDREESPVLAKSEEIPNYMDREIDLDAVASEEIVEVKNKEDLVKKNKDLEDAKDSFEKQIKN